MKIENQVCTLQQAKRLKELGVEQNSLCDWLVVMPDITGENYYYVVYPKGEVVDTLHEVIASAFTIAELSIMIPTHITHNEEQYFFEIIRGSKRWLAEWHTNKRDLSVLSDGELDRPRGVLWNTYKGNKFLVNVFADWLIHLLETNTITAASVNERIQNG